MFIYEMEKREEEGGKISSQKDNCQWLNERLNCP